ncbi:M23 family metallopeptidase [Pseudahrensia aquimaris]|uniref:M23 family metallopeptidase n=1 Tax=Pseudahrensia aquimaris TaxID=744461 RepID=A0ABW3FEU9_9HYPH
MTRSQIFPKTIMPLLAASLFGLSLSASAKDTTAPSLSLPIDCTIGKDCWVQNLVDFNLADGTWQDPYCGTATFDKHKGTDIRVPFVKDLDRNIPILAMADGEVVGLRRDMEDFLVQNADDVRKIQGKECGNGAILLHANGWTTQYCHLKKDSVNVKKGDKLKRGDAIGIMGLSGHTTFPHIHVTVRKGKSVIDPMTGKNQTDQCSPQESIAASLWDAKAREGMTGASSAILGTGFAGEVVKSGNVLTGEMKTPQQAGPLVFWAYLINLRPNDRIDLRIMDNNGTYVETLGKPLKGPLASYTAYTGRKRALERGNTYRGEAVLWRNGQVIQTVQSEPIKF